jgi:hypothetical protein
MQKEVEMASVRWSRPIAAALLTALAACGDNEFPTTPGTPVADAVTAMTRAIQDEFLAENTYLRVLAEFGRVAPFQNILYVEQRHSEAIAYLFLKRGLSVPESSSDINSVPVYSALQAACAAAVEVEEDIIAMYDELLAQNLPADVSQVFTSNRASSFNNRLPAFQACD